jgi:hypothetical protein
MRRLLLKVEGGVKPPGGPIKAYIEGKVPPRKYAIGG